MFEVVCEDCGHEQRVPSGDAAPTCDACGSANLTQRRTSGSP